MSDTQAFALHHVVIDRDKEHVSTDVPAHEIAVLEAVHGRAKVKDHGATEDEIELDLSADGEFARLQRKYFRVNAPDLVLRAYPSGPRELREFGFSLNRGAREDAPQSEAIKHPKPKADPKAEAKKKDA